MTQGLELRGAVLGKGYRLGRRVNDLDDTVFEATHERIPGHFVIRLFAAETLLQPEAASRIQRGARVASLLRDRHAVQVLDCNVSGEVPAFVVMERLQGRTLAEIMAEDGMLPLPRVAELVESLASALAAGHQLGLVHGDVHPTHVIVPASGLPPAKLSGFGWAKELRAAARLPLPSGYLAPEQQFGKVLAVDERTDQFGLAALAYELIAACLPFSEESADLADMLGQRRTPPAIADLVPGVPETLDEVLRRALAFTPTDRFSDVLEFSAHLRAVAADQSNTVTPAPVPAQTPAPRQLPPGDVTTPDGAMPIRASTDPTEELDLATLTTYPVEEEQVFDDVKLVLGAVPAAADDAKTPVGGSPLFARDGLDGPVPEAREPQRQEAAPLPALRRFPTGRPSGPHATLDGQGSGRSVILPPPDTSSRRWVAEPSMKNQLSSIWLEVSKRRKLAVPAAIAVALLLVLGAVISTAGRSSDEPSSARASRRSLADSNAVPPRATSVQVEPLPSPPSGTAPAFGSDGRPIFPARGQSNPRGIRPGSVYGAGPMTTRAFSTDVAEDCWIGITSKPWAEVWIDGKNTGRKTPIDRLKVACGTRRLALRRPDQDLERVVMLKVVPGVPYRGDYDLVR